MALPDCLPCAVAQAFHDLEVPLVLTSAAYPADIPSSLSGCDFILKPFRLDKLVATLEAAMAGPGRKNGGGA